MSRPDAMYWRNTNHLTSLEFTPGRLVYNRIPKWVSGLLVLQIVLGATIWCGVRVSPAKEWPSALFGVDNPATAAPAVGKVHPPARFPGQAQVISTEDAALLLSFVASQLAATVLVQLVALPLVRRALRRHTGGLKDVFEAIRAMASGLAPKALAAGRPGESSFLALAFNDMMARLSAQRKELIEANETLEKKVAVRTQELREAAEKLEKMAQLDALTGLPNRRALMDQGERKFQTASEAGDDLACLMIDLDNFKSVNDTLGHAAGDEVIRVAADTLRGSCRPDDFAARLGGDEFTVLMAAQGLNQTLIVAQRLQDEFRKRIETAFAGKAVTSMPSMSIGITSLKSSTAAHLADLMSHADTALYQAKYGGKARAHVYSKDAA